MKPKVLLQRLLKFVYEIFKFQWSWFHHPDDGGSTRLRNVGLLLPDYTALYPRKLSSTYEWVK
jgi:hypothetical protein